MAARITAGLHSAGTEDGVSTAKAPWSIPTIRAAPVHIPVRRHPRGLSAFGEHELPVLSLCADPRRWENLSLSLLVVTVATESLRRARHGAKAELILLPPTLPAAGLQMPHAAWPRPPHPSRLHLPPPPPPAAPAHGEDSLSTLASFLASQSSGDLFQSMLAWKNLQKKKHPPHDAYFRSCWSPAHTFSTRTRSRSAGIPRYPQPAAPRDSPHPSRDAARGPKLLARGLVTAPQHLEP